MIYIKKGYNPNSRNFKKGHKINVGKKSSEEKINKLKKYCGEKHSCWKGGSKWYYGKIAIRVMEKGLGRKIIKGEVVHHLDNNYKNYNLNNLYLFPSNSKHKIYHELLRRIIREFLNSQTNVKED